MTAAQPLRAKVPETMADGRADLRRLFPEVADGLYRFIYLRVGRNRSLADDLLQQTCVEAVRSTRPPAVNGECEAWLRGIARNLVRRHWRNSRTRAKHESVVDPVLSRELLDAMETGPLPETILARRELTDQLLLAVTELPSSAQLVVYAFYFNGRSHTDIAGELGVTPKSVETRLYRTRERLRAILADSERKDES